MLQVGREVDNGNSGLTSGEVQCSPRFPTQRVSCPERIQRQTRVACCSLQWFALFAFMAAIQLYTSSKL